MTDIKKVVIKQVTYKVKVDATQKIFRIKQKTPDIIKIKFGDRVSGAAIGMPPGGGTGFVLTKASPADYDTLWAPSAGGGTSIYYNVKTYGVIGDGVTDDHTKLEIAAAAAAAGEGTLYFPPGDYATSQEVYIPAGCDVLMEGTLLYTGGGNVSCMRIGSSAGQNNSRNFRLAVMNETYSDWQNEASIGIELVNCNNSMIVINEVTGFTIGVRYHGNTTGIAYNTTMLGLMVMNKIDVDLYGSNAGWANENKFFGGRFAQWDNHPTLKNIDRIGIRMGHDEGGTTYDCNGNIFYSPSFEINPDDAGTGVPTELLVNHGDRNAVYDARVERAGGNTAGIVVTDNYSNNNTFTASIVSPDDALRVDDRGAYPSTKFRSSFDYNKDTVMSIWDSGALAAKAYHRDGGTAFQGLNTIDRATGVIAESEGPMNISSHRILLGANAGIGIFADTMTMKKFVVTRVSNDTDTGRVLIKCYDTNGAILQDSGVTNWDYLKPDQAPDGVDDMYWSVVADGYYQARDFQRPLLVEVHDDVKFVHVSINDGASVVWLHSFQIHAVDLGTVVTTWDGIQPKITGGSNFGQLVSDESPDQGASGTLGKLGTIVQNSVPSEANGLGWICATAGNPGTWEKIQHVDWTNAGLNLLTSGSGEFQSNLKVGGNVYVNNQDLSNDAFIYFHDGIDPDQAWLWFDYNAGQFAFSHPLASQISGGMANLTITDNFLMALTMDGGGILFPMYPDPPGPRFETSEGIWWQKTQAPDAVTYASLRYDESNYHGDLLFVYPEFGSGGDLVVNAHGAQTLGTLIFYSVNGGGAKGELIWNGTNFYFLAPDRLLVASLSSGNINQVLTTDTDGSTVIWKDAQGGSVGGAITGDSLHLNDDQDEDSQVTETETWIKFSSGGGTGYPTGEPVPMFRLEHTATPDGLGTFTINRSLYVKGANLSLYGGITSLTGGSIAQFQLVSIADTLKTNEPVYLNQNFNHAEGFLYWGGGSPGSELIDYSWIKCKLGTPFTFTTNQEWDFQKDVAIAGNLLVPTGIFEIGTNPDTLSTDGCVNIISGHLVIGEDFSADNDIFFEIVGDGSAATKRGRAYFGDAVYLNHRGGAADGLATTALYFSINSSPGGAHIKLDQAVGSKFKFEPEIHPTSFDIGGAAPGEMLIATDANNMEWQSFDPLTLENNTGSTLFNALVLEDGNMELEEVGYGIYFASGTVGSGRRAYSITSNSNGLNVDGSLELELPPKFGHTGLSSAYSMTFQNNIGFDSHLVYTAAAELSWDRPILLPHIGPHKFGQLTQDLDIVFQFLNLNFNRDEGDGTDERDLTFTTDGSLHWTGGIWIDKTIWMSKLMDEDEGGITDTIRFANVRDTGSGIPTTDPELRFVHGADGEDGYFQLTRNLLANINSLSGSTIYVQDAGDFSKVGGFTYDDASGVVSLDKSLDITGDLVFSGSISTHSHSASQITGGSFQSGTFRFPLDVQIDDNLYLNYDALDVDVIMYFGHNAVQTEDHLLYSISGTRFEFSDDLYIGGDLTLSGTLPSHNHTASDVTDFDTEVGNHADVLAAFAPANIYKISGVGEYTEYVAASDTNAARGTILDTAIAAASAGDVLVVRAGTYDADDLMKDGITIHFEAGAKVIYTGNGISIFDDEAALRHMVVTGFGVFQNSGSNAANRRVVNLTNGASTLYIEAKDIISDDSVAIRLGGTGAAVVNCYADTVQSSDGTLDNVSTGGTILVRARKLISSAGYVIEQDGGTTEVYGALLESSAVNPVEAVSGTKIWIQDCIIKSAGTDPCINSSMDAGTLTVVSSVFDCAIATDVWGNADLIGCTRTDGDTVVGASITLIGHEGADGSDHSFIDQDVTDASAPTFTGTNFTLIPWAGVITAFGDADDILPDQATHSGHFLTTNGTVSSWVAGGGGGEVNTASSASTGGGISLYYQKSTYDLEFNGIKSENNLLGIVLDGATHDIELTVNEANINHANITAGDGSDHTFIDQSVISGATPTFTGTNLTGVPAAGILAGIFGAGTFEFQSDIKVDAINEKTTDNGIEIDAGTVLFKDGAIYLDYTGANNGAIYAYDDASPTAASISYDKTNNQWNFSHAFNAGGEYMSMSGWDLHINVDGVAQVPALWFGHSSDPYADSIKYILASTRFEASDDFHIIGDLTLTGGIPEAAVTAHEAAIVHDNISGGTATVAHGATGAVVGTTNSQTLTQKTLTTPTIGDFTNATHDHADAAGGGVLPLDEAIQVVLGDGSAVIPSTLVVEAYVKCNMTIDGWTIVEATGTSGSIVVDVWEDTYTNHPPTVADTITGSEKPTISSSTKGQDLSLNGGSGWALTKGSILRFKIDSVTSCKQVTVALHGVRT